ncbi:hypothetical protein [Propioniciclava flava]
MPEAELRSFDWQRLSLPVLAEHLWEWGISTQALSVRLRSLGPRTRCRGVAAALTLKTQTFLRRHWAKPPGPDPITLRMELAAEHSASPLN